VRDTVMKFLEAAAARAADASSAAATAPLPPASGEAHEEKLKDASYTYWHDKVPSGAPKPEHKPIAVEAGCGDIPTVSIDNFGLMDDDDIVKVYVKLEGDLEGLTADAVEFKVEQAKYDPTCSMLLLARGKTKMHRLHAEKLRHHVEPDGCKFRISTKNSKLIVTLKKGVPEYWDALRAPNTLPFRRGGGGAPR